MTRKVVKPDSNPEPGAIEPAGPEELVVRLGARESLLRELLLEARDELVRFQLGGAPLRASEPASPKAAPPSRSVDPGYAALRGRLIQAIRSTVPPGARLIVVSRGDEALLDFGGHARAEHFPGDGAGRYAGHHPADSSAAIAELEAARTAGAEFLVLPTTSVWWLEHYSELARYLGGRFRRVLDAPETGIAFDLRAPARAPVGLPARVDRPRAQGARQTIGAATIISRNYLAQARVLAKSYFEHEPDGRFYLLVVDRLPEGVDPGPGVTLVDPRDLAIPNFDEMCFKYNVIELSTAVKPYLLSRLMSTMGEELAVYLDPDILIQGPFDELRSALAGASAVLTPHITRPLPVDGKHPTEQDIMISGAFNLGFIALRRSPEAAELLAWWEERLADGCRIDVPNGLFTDQKWIDLAPSLFPGAAILRDPTYNVAFWNLHERELQFDGERFEVNGRPATFFHVSGFDPNKPGKLSKHQSRIEVEPGSPLAALLDRYAALLKAEGYDESIGWEYGFERFASGMRVHPLLRQIYLNLSVDERARFGDPFAEGPGSFLEWAIGPGEKQGSLSRFLEAIYQMRYDLPLAFPDVRGRDRTAFLQWARRWGAEEMRFEPELVRDDPWRPDARPADTPGRNDAAPSRALPLSEYRDLVEQLRDEVRAVLPPGARALVVNKGDYRMLELGGVEGLHFPQAPGGSYGGFYPGTSELAIAHLESLREKGARYLVLPRTAFWWLDHYEGLQRHLEERCRLLVKSDVCQVYELGSAAATPVSVEKLLHGSEPATHAPATREIPDPIPVPAEWRTAAATSRSSEASLPPAASGSPAASRAPAVLGSVAAVEPPIVIYGAARSGTTYLVKILNKHPQIYISDESRIFLWAHEMMQRARWHERAGQGQIDEPGGRRYDDRSHLHTYLQNALPELLREFYREIAPEAGLWGDKNPHYADPRDVGCLETIVELYPGARFIHLIRDGRDVVTSGLRGVWTDFDRVHAMWNSHLDLGRSFGRTLPASQYIELHYEELVKDDAGVAGRLLDILGVSRDPAVERFCRRQSERRTEFCSPTRDLDGDPLRSDWGSFLSAAQRLRSLDLLGSNLVRFGYETPESLAKAREALVPLAASEVPPL